MGVTYKLKDEVVHFIIRQRQDNPLSSCRQLAESASQKFSLHLSKSSVHDVLKESGIITPRGRKPKNKFEIPQEKKKQIQASLSQAKLLPSPADLEEHLPRIIASPQGGKTDSLPSVTRNDEAIILPPPLPPEEDVEVSAEYEGAGKVFLKAVFWDLGLFSEENIKESDWDYYLTYVKGIKVVLENGQGFFIDLPVPVERCIKEAADGLINNTRPLAVHHVSDETLFKTCMDAQPGIKITKISIVGHNYHILFELDDIMELKRSFILKNMVIVESNERSVPARIKSIFFPQIIDNNDLINNVLNLRGFDTIGKGENTVSLLIDDTCNNKTALHEAAEKLNGMYLRDDQGRSVKVKILSSQG